MPVNNSIDSFSQRSLDMKNSTLSVALERNLGYKILGTAPKVDKEENARHSHVTESYDAEIDERTDAFEPVRELADELESQWTLFYSCFEDKDTVTQLSRHGVPRIIREWPKKYALCVENSEYEEVRRKREMEQCEF